MNIVVWKKAASFLRVMLSTARTTLQACFLLAGSWLAIIAAVEILQALNGQGAMVVEQEQMKMAAMTTAMLARDAIAEKAVGTAQSSSNEVIANVSSVVSVSSGGTGITGIPDITDDKVADLAHSYAKAIKGVNPKQLTGIDVVAVLFVFYALFYIISAIACVASINAEFDKHGSLLSTIQEKCQAKVALLRDACESNCEASDSDTKCAQCKKVKVVRQHVEFMTDAITAMKEQAANFPMTILGRKITWGMLYGYVLTLAFISIQYVRESAIHYVREACSDFGTRADDYLDKSSITQTLGVTVNASGMLFEMICLPLEAEIGSKTADLANWVNTTITGLE